MLKTHYCTKYIKCALDYYDTSVTPSKIYDIDQLQAMWLADMAWHEVDTTTIRNCWKKLILFHRQHPLTHWFLIQVFQSPHSLMLVTPVVLKIWSQLLRSGLRALLMS